MAQARKERGIVRLSTVGSLLLDSAALAAHTANIRLSQWQEIVGERLAQKATPERIADGTLTIRVPSSTWAQEMSLLSEMIVERLRKHRHPIRKLRFRVAPKQVHSAGPTVRVSKARLPRSLAHHIASVEDEALRAVLEEAASYSLARGTRELRRQGGGRPSRKREKP